MIKSTRVFSDFEKAFNHFFADCERGFTNEVIINLYCRLYTPGKTIIPYKSTVRELYFIKNGEVSISFRPEDDLITPKKKRG